MSTFWHWVASVRFAVVATGLTISAIERYHARRARPLPAALPDPYAGMKIDTEHLKAQLAEMSQLSARYAAALKDSQL